MPARWNDGSSRAPRLCPAHALWALIGLPRGGPEWSLDEKFQRVAEAGFEAVECWPDPSTARDIQAGLNRNGLRLGYGFRADNLPAFREGVSRARDMGADYMNAHVESPYMPLDVMVDLCQGVVDLSRTENFPIFVETHRGTLTENLYRVWEVIDRVPDIRFTADLSHYALASEGTAMTALKLAPVLERVSSFHARVSNGQQIQIDIGNGENEWARQFVDLWAVAMRAWRKSAGPGDILPFVSELGPPTYGLVDRDGVELSDRWEQSLVLRRLGEEAWRLSGQNE